MDQSGSMEFIALIQENSHENQLTKEALLEKKTQIN